jgi:hypothetical protein
MPAWDTTIRPNQAEIASKVIDGEAIMINLSNGRYYSMQSPGGAVWEIISAGTTPEALANELRRRYDAAPGIIERDVRGLVDLLLNERLVVTSDLPVADLTGAGSSAVTLPYSSPHLEVYTDMGELLALDPPLPGIDDIPYEPAKKAGS